MVVKKVTKAKLESAWVFLRAAHTWAKQRAEVEMKPLPTANPTSLLSFPERGPWGDAHYAGNSSGADENEFLDKLHVLLLNQREATRPGGHYVTLIGDRRKHGSYSSYQADCITRMPRDELKSVVIKAQHNVSSRSQSYSLRYPLVMHEYLLVWKRDERSLYALWQNLVEQAHRALQGTWRALV